MTGPETPAGEAASPLPAQDAALREPQPPSRRHQIVLEGAARSRKGAKRRPWIDRLTPVPRSNSAAYLMERDGRPKRSAGQAALRPDDGRSAPNRTRASEAKHKVKDMNETERAIEAAKTAAGGWTRDTLSKWGVSWPPPKGWRQRLIKTNALKETAQ